MSQEKPLDENVNDLENERFPSEDIEMRHETLPTKEERERLLKVIDGWKSAQKKAIEQKTLLSSWKYLDIEESEKQKIEEALVKHTEIVSQARDMITQLEKLISGGKEEADTEPSLEMLTEEEKKKYLSITETWKNLEKKAHENIKQLKIWEALVADKPDEDEKKKIAVALAVQKETLVTGAHEMEELKKAVPSKK